MTESTFGQDAVDQLQQAAPGIHMYADQLARQDMVRAAAVVREFAEGEDLAVTGAHHLSDVKDMDELERDLLMLTVREMAGEFIEAEALAAGSMLTAWLEEMEAIYGPPEDREH